MILLCQFKIINCGDYFTIANIKGGYDNHCHVKRKKTAKMLIKLMEKKRVPRSDYLRESAKRCTLDVKYIRDIDNKISKDKNKQQYCNIGGGKR